MPGTSRKNENFKRIYDFNSERLILKIISGYSIQRKPTSAFLLNLLLIICVLLLYLYLLVMSVYTLAFTVNEGAIKVQTFLALCLIVVGIFAPVIKLHYEDNIREALKFIKMGFYKYKGEEKPEEHIKIIENRISQIRLITFSYAVWCYICAFANTLQSPVIQMLTPKEDNPQVVNPYLPLPICMLFDSRSYHGFIAAFVSNTLFLFLFYTCVISIPELYLSYGLQLVAQLEAMNYSLRNIEKRAITKLIFDNKMDSTAPADLLYEREDFQKYLYFCLRSNIQHHHAILKYTHEIKRFLEPMNSLILLVFAVIFASSIVPVLQDPTSYIALSATLVGETAGYLQVYWMGQVVTDKSAETIQSLYSTPWPCCKKNFKVLLTLMITNTQKPIVFRSPGFGLSISLETFGDMMSMAYKLVNILLNFL